VVFPIQVGAFTLHLMPASCAAGGGKIQGAHASRLSTNALLSGRG